MNKIEGLLATGGKNTGLPDGVSRVNLMCDRHGPYTALAASGHIGGCPKCVKLRDAETERRQREAAKREETDAKVAAIGIPPRYKGVGIDTFGSLGGGGDKTREGILSAVKAVKGYADNWAEASKTGRSMLFIGSPGTGKTLLACGLAADIVRHYGCSAAYASLLDIISDVKYAWACKQPDDQALRRYIDAGLLIIDEVSACYGTAAERLLLYRLINKRYERVKPVILISNLTANETREAIGEPTWDRLREGGGVKLVFDWPSFRGGAR